MCGIAGIVGENCRDEKISYAVSRLKHRGPDEQAIITGSWYALGATRLAITDPIKGKQPHLNESLDIAVVFNGQIYNFRELWKKFASEVSGPISQRSDTHLIPYLYREYGPDFLKHIDGMFAMCILDLSTHEVLLARDRFGQKPLFYDFNQAKVALRFASEIDALVALEETRYQRDIHCIPGFLALKHLSHKNSGRHHIAEIPPASSLSFQLGSTNLRLNTYWKSGSKDTQCQCRQKEKVTEVVERLLVESIEERIPRDVPPAFALSGGIDSSLVVGLAHKHGLVKNAPTYTLTYPDGVGGRGKSDDQFAARSVAELFKTDHREVRLDPEQFCEEFSNIVRAVGQPFIGTMSMWFLAKEVSRDFKVLISGDGADEQLGSYLTHRLAAKIEQMGASGSGHPDVNAELRIPIESDISSGAQEKQSWIRASTLFSKDEVLRLLESNSKTSEEDYESAAVQVEARYRNHRENNTIMKALLLSELETIFPDQVLKYIDRLSMAHGLEVRTPFLDHQISDLFLSLELKFRVRNGEFKWILKEVAGRILPAQLIDRPKEGFVSPFFLWRSQVLRPLAEKYLTQRMVEDFGVFKWAAVKPLVARLQEPNSLTHSEANKVLALVSAHIWISE